MLRPSPNHGTQRLPNDDDDDDIYIYSITSLLLGAYPRHDVSAKFMPLCLLSCHRTNTNIDSLDCQKRSRSGLCSKLPDLRSVGDIALNSSLHKSKRE